MTQPNIAAFELENRCAFTGTVGSNPTLSAKSISYLYEI